MKIIIYSYENNQEKKILQVSTQRKNATWTGLEKTAMHELREKMIKKGYADGIIYRASSQIIHVYCQKSIEPWADCLRVLKFRIELNGN